jgi:acetylornithine/succinyldiaminopimelate/putrescine aminotransferase
LCVLDELVGRGLIAQIAGVGRLFDQRLRAMAAKHAIVKEIRGFGLMWGIELTGDAAPVVPAALERGIIVNRTAERVVRLLPPLVITEDDASLALDRLDEVLGVVTLDRGPKG